MSVRERIKICITKGDFVYQTVNQKKTLTKSKLSISISVARLNSPFSHTPFPEDILLMVNFFWGALGGKFVFAHLHTYNYTIESQTLDKS
jgi:hypothetical protein